MNSLQEGGGGRGSKYDAVREGAEWGKGRKGEGKDKREEEKEEARVDRRGKPEDEDVFLLALQLEEGTGSQRA